MIAGRPLELGVPHCAKRGRARKLPIRRTREPEARTRARQAPAPGKAHVMKTALIATLCAVAATAATAQLAAPISPGVSPTVRADPEANAPEQAQLRADRDRVKADKDRLKAARDAHDDAAIRSGQATLRADMEALRVDHEKLADANSGESLKR